LCIKNLNGSLGFIFPENYYLNHSEQTIKTSTETMKTIFIASALALVLLSSCGQTEKPKEMYCGIGMSAFEVIDAKTMAANFKYTEADKPCSLPLLPK
jgi:hypothetical protein